MRAESLEALHALCALWLEQPHLADKMAAFPAVALPVSTHAVRNNRRKMEDRHVTLPDLNCVLDIQVCDLVLFANREPSVSTGRMKVEGLLHMEIRRIHRTLQSLYFIQPPKLTPECKLQAR